MENIKILYVASEINPFLNTSEVSEFVRRLPQAMQERGMEIRILVPRFGLINERKNRLHEVVRLSGINISVGDEEKPLIIKVASIPNAKLQVFFADNDERAIFFCKGVVETIKKLGWAPDIIHCNDWMTSMIPLYVKTTYKNDPIFKESKTVFTIYDNKFTHQFGDDLMDKVRMIDIDDSMLQELKSANYEGFIKLGAQYSDAIIYANQRSTDSFEKLMTDIVGEKKTDTIEKDENLEDSYFNLYNELVG